MLDPRISFKNRWLAGVLTFLIPGAGQIYQGRYFKGILCAVCILGTFFMGMQLGDWSVVFWKPDPTNFLNPYYAQFFAGLPALPALVQSRRSEDRRNVEQSSVDSPLDAPFHGTLRLNQTNAANAEGTVDGRITLQGGEASDGGSGVHGEFSGTLTPASGRSQERKLTLGGLPIVGRPVAAGRNRPLEVDVVEANGRAIGRIQGTIPRSFLNGFEVPPDEKTLDDLHRQLGKWYELALTFTMVAGLLNILAILDAIEGPAYGYGLAMEKDESKPAGRPPVAAVPERSALMTTGKAATLLPTPKS